MPFASPEWVGLGIAVLAVTAPAAFFFGRLQGEVAGLRRDVETLKARQNALEVAHGVLAATVVTPRKGDVQEIGERRDRAG